ncbi:hypothetical protein JH06_4441 [Blastocystis sp. subtype 4]|uniref:hypothetical protein n=1 Tax=Blastocystis sp. subtype 4 TaxID=944170 RepID=UPI000711D852|nr:hypothetical protein JH06_4441 [Blastocystis sp. subtype 4]KNB41999.1 hypothetical protein JH06_4441 [Blastocystis sp. subtype 4]|eukprot:XP_014525442.1 hypothetical protein JH06_4441 [Blastocystis sp. subtype 4]
MVLSFLYTGVYDPGVIRSTEENSLARGSVLESQKYSYCSLCDLYRPEGAKHCPKCGVCLYNCDHHCIVMGQCVARNNLITFYVFLVSLFLVQFLHFYMGTSLASHYFLFLKSFYIKLGKLLHIIPSLVCTNKSFKIND